MDNRENIEQIAQKIEQNSDKIDEMEVKIEPANQDNQKVIFSAVRNEGNIAKGTIITYNQLVTNVGNGMNINTGRFKAPLPGIYYFSFSGRTDTSSHYIYIDIWKNDVEQFDILDSNDSGNYNTFELLSYAWTMVLKENDEVHLRVEGPKGLDVRRSSPVWFNGFLLLKSN